MIKHEALGGAIKWVNTFGYHLAQAIAEELETRLKDCRITFETTNAEWAFRLTAIMADNEVVVSMNWSNESPTNTIRVSRYEQVQYMVPGRVVPGSTMGHVLYRQYQLDDPKLIEKIVNAIIRLL